MFSSLNLKSDLNLKTKMLPTTFKIKTYKVLKLSSTPNLIMSHKLLSCTDGVQLLLF